MERELSARFLALCSHYLFEPCFARPGEGHDKGGVEARGKNVRLQHLTPIPGGESLAAIAALLVKNLDAASATRADQQGRSVAQRFDEERTLLRPLPGRPFEARQVEPVGVSRQALVRVEGAQYSVPSHWAGSQATAYVGVADIVLEWREERSPTTNSIGADASAPATGSNSTSRCSSGAAGAAGGDSFSTQYRSDQ